MRTEQERSGVGVPFWIWRVVLYLGIIIYIQFFWKSAAQRADQPSEMPREEQASEDDTETVDLRDTDVYPKITVLAWSHAPDNPRQVFVLAHLDGRLDYLEWGEIGLADGKETLLAVAKSPSGASKPSPGWQLLAFNLDEKAEFEDGVLRVFKREHTILDKDNQWPYPALLEGLKGAREQEKKTAPKPNSIKT